MKLMGIAFFLLFLKTLSCFSQTESGANLLYLKFSKAYESLSAVDITQQYTDDATILTLYQNDKPNSLQGISSIEKHYKDFFQNWKSKNTHLNLVFKIAERKTTGAVTYDNGFYALEISEKNKPKQTFFGKFSTVLHLINGEWKFYTDATSTATFTEFENTVAPLISASDFYLYSEFYDQLLGSYKTTDNKIITIGRSQTRLYAYYPERGMYRGLQKINATIWTAGEKIISDSSITTYNFIQTGNGYKLGISKSGTKTVVAEKINFYTTQKVLYKNNDGINLGGTMFLPKKPNGKAIVLIHGSGPQDRNGYASIIRLLADVLTSNGTTVLTYDKQGVGSSSGNWESESFEQLADDALAGINYLKSNKQLKFTKIGLGGSSQAGWIIAKAIKKNKAVDFVLTIGAAGSGVSVTEQNLYNTKVLMECQNFTASQIITALTQQNLFYEYLQNKSDGKVLDNFTIIASKDSLLRDWLYPTSKEIDFTNKNQWYTALEINYNPIAAWKQYNKPTLMLFSEFDDSTPTDIVIKNLRALNKNNIIVKLLPKSQHIGLVTDSLCNADIGNLQKFNSHFFSTIINWIKSL